MSKPLKIDNEIRIHYLWCYRFYTKAKIARTLNIPRYNVDKIIEKNEFTQYVNGDEWVTVPEFSDYRFNKLNYKVVKVGFGEIKPYLDKSIGYCTIFLNNKKHRFHRLVYASFTGKWPTYEIDHQDGNKQNNLIENLRECTRSENARNSKLPKNNISGYKGVHFHKQSNKWVANIRLNGKKKHLGLFKTAIEAAKIYDQFAVKHHGEFALTNEMLGLYETNDPNNNNN